MFQLDVDLSGTGRDRGGMAADGLQRHQLAAKLQQQIEQALCIVDVKLHMPF